MASHYTSYNSNSSPWQRWPCVICLLASFQRLSCVPSILEWHLLRPHWPRSCSWNAPRPSSLPPFTLAACPTTYNSFSRLSEGPVHPSAAGFNVCPSARGPEERHRRPAPSPLPCSSLTPHSQGARVLSPAFLLVCGAPHLAELVKTHVYPFSSRLHCSGQCFAQEVARICAVMFVSHLEVVRGVCVCVCVCARACVGG